MKLTAQFGMKALQNMLALAVFALGASSLVSAQTTGTGAWPTQKPIRLIAVFPPGGSVDQVARILAPALQAELKQNVIVENVGGASGVIGTSAMTRSDLVEALAARFSQLTHRDAEYAVKTILDAMGEVGLQRGVDLLLFGEARRGGDLRQERPPAHAPTESR